MAAVLKQAVERIARMRDAALLHLHALLSSPQLAALMPAASTISTCVPKVRLQEVVSRSACNTFTHASCCS